MFQAEDGIRDVAVTGVQTCALPILFPRPTDPTKHVNNSSYRVKLRNFHYKMGLTTREHIRGTGQRKVYKYTNHLTLKQIGRASCRERV